VQRLGPTKAVPGDSPLAQVEELAKDYPWLYAAVDLKRLNSWASWLRRQPPAERDFGPNGRGIQYLSAQARNLTARSVGINRLVSIILETARDANTQIPLMVDLLGGDGLVQRVCTVFGHNNLSILTCDLSPYMVAEAWKKGVPALLQRAEQPLLKSSSVDAVLLAYGSHHIPPELRQTAVSEAYRILRPGGILLFHDFLNGSATETWFRNVVDSYSSTGHQYPHFSSSAILGYLKNAGFERCEVQDLADPYTATGSDPEMARYNMGDYLVRMYGLTKAELEFGEHEARLWAVRRAQEIFRSKQDRRCTDENGLRYDDVGRTWTIELQRWAVIGLGQKDGRPKRAGQAPGSVVGREVENR
jgi:SAM-dependent methyltransferase